MSVIVFQHEGRTATSLSHQCTCRGNGKVKLTVGQSTGFAFDISRLQTWQIVSQPTSGHHVLFGSNSTSTRKKSNVVKLIKSFKNMHLVQLKVDGVSLYIAFVS